MRQGQSWPYATVVCAAFRPADGGLQVELASAGHPPGLLRHADGTLEEVVANGLMIGVQASLALQPVSVTLGAGDSLALYTDGMVDARREDERFGEERLAEVVQTAPDSGAESAAEHIAEAVLAFETGSPRDDRALMVLRPR
jgi:serine phosphatase RsbU (regulator of sigma subunit)